ncbi:MAG: type II toxin-antitoxin system RelE/ParE family toxin [Fibromonadales bacterium]|nr:type II toxin-antitoxin system RelE/ParE family toxin [Fibromonadales bacterium]
MAAYQTKLFKKWNKKNRIPDEKLLDAIKSIDSGSGIVNYGEGLHKVRIAKDKGKSSGYRTIIVHKKGFRSFVVYGFEKNEKANISDNEKTFLKNYGMSLLNSTEKEIEEMLENGEIFKMESSQ